MPNTTTTLLAGDGAQKSLDDDKFGLGVMAEAIAEALRDRVVADGYAVGIEGEWGSGKTTLLNFIDEILRKDKKRYHQIIRFNPWLIGKKEVLLRTLLEDLTVSARKLSADLRVAGKLTEKLKDAFDHFAKNVELYTAGLEAAASTVAVGSAVYVGQVAAAAPITVKLWIGLAKILTKLLKLVVGKFKERTSSLEFLKNQVVGDLTKIKEELPWVRFTVLIDDTDRLDPEESIEILRLIKSVADFPLVTYLVGFDQKILATQVEAIVKGENGERYLEKIFQQIIPIPPQEPFALRKFIRSQLEENFLDEMYPSRADDPEFDIRKNVVFDAWLGRFITNPREAIRLCEAIKFGWPYIKDNGADFWDYVWLQLIKLHCRKLYKWVQKYVSDLGSFRDDGRPGDDAGIVQAQELRAILIELGWREDNQRLDIKYILPGLRNFSLQGEKNRVFDFQSDDELKNFEADARLGSPIHWRVYFAFTRPSYAIDDAELKAFRGMLASSWEKAAEKLKELAFKPHPFPGDHLRTFLEYLSDQKKSFGADERIAITKAFAHVMDEVPRSVKGDLGMRDSWRLSMLFINSDVSPVFEEIVRAGKSINWLSLIIRDQAFALGKSNTKGTDPDRAWIKPDVFDRSLGCILQRYKEMGLQSIFKLPEPIMVLFCWEQLGDAKELKKLMAEATVSDEGFLSALDAMRSWVNSSAKGLYRALDDDIIQYFMDVGAAKSRLQQLATDNSPPPPNTPSLKPKAEDILSASKR